MKVYQILEAKTIVKKGPLQGFSFDTLDDGQIKITAPDGKTSIASNRYAAEIRAKEMLPGAKAPTPIVNQPKGDAPKVGPATPTDTPKAPAFKAGVKPGTPTSDSLSRGQERKLARHGKIKVNGQLYTRAMIDAADAEAARLSGSDAGKDIRPGDDKVKPTTKPDTPDTPDDPPKGLLGKILDALGSRVSSTLKALFSTKVAVVLNSAINISAFEDQLDALLRAIKEDSLNVDIADRQAFLTGLEKGNLTPKVNIAYLESVERFNQLIVEAVISIVLAGGWTAAALLTGFSIGTGGVGAILSLVAGGAFVVGGTMLLYQLFESLGINDWLESNISGRLMNPKRILATAYSVNGTQEWFGESLDWLGGIAGADDAGDIVRDSITYTENKNNAINPNKAKAIIKDFIKSNPKMQAAYKRGKEEAKEIIRAGDPEEESN